MAEENLKAQVILTVDDSGATKSIDNLASSINKAGDSAKGWAQQVGDLKKQLASVDPSSREWAELALQYKELGGSAKVVGQSTDELKARLDSFGKNLPTEQTKTLKQQIRELQNTLTSGQIAQGTDEYKKLSAQLSDLKDRQKDFNEEIGANAGSAVESTSQNLNLLKDRLLSLDFEGAAISAKSLAGNISGLDFKKVTQGIGSLGTAFGAIGKALLTNPIFLIGSALAAAIVYSEELLSLIDGVSSAEEEALKIQQDKAASAEKELNDIGAQEQILKRQGLTEKEILKIKIEKGQAALNEQQAIITTLELQKQQQIEAATRNRDILKGLLNFISIPLTAILAGVDLLTNGLKSANLISEETFANIGNLREKFTTSVAELVFDPEEVSAEGDKAIAAAKDKLKTLENQQAGFANSLDSINAQAREKVKQNEAEVTQAIKDAREARFQAGLSDEDKELRQLDFKYEKLKTQAGKNQDLINQLAAEKEAERLGILKRYSDLELAQQAAKDKALADQVRANKQAEAAELEDLEEQNFQAGLSAKDRELVALRDSYFERIEILKAAGADSANLENELLTKEGEIRDRYRQEEKKKQDDADKEAAEKAKQLSDARIQAASNTVNTLLSLNEAFAGKSQQSQKAAFQRQKALQIAQTGIETYKAAQGAYASQLIPGDPTSVPRAFIAAAAAVAAGLANVAKIKATTFSSPAPSGGSNTSVPSLSSQGVAATGGTVPEFNPLAAFNIQNQPPQAQPAYVLAGDVASSLEARAKVQDLARL